MDVVVIIDLSEYYVDICYKDIWYSSTLTAKFMGKPEELPTLAVLDFLDELKFRSPTDFLLEDILEHLRKFIEKIGNGTNPVFEDDYNTTLFSYQPDFFDVVVQTDYFT